MTIVYCLEKFSLKYNKIFLGKLESDEYATVEELVEGSFVKHINNNGDICGGLWVQIPSGARIFSEFSKHLIYQFVVSSLIHICGDTNNPVCNKAECLAHYSFERSNKEVMVVDIQGCDHFLFDPEVASKELKSSEEFFFCSGN